MGFEKKSNMKGEKASCSAQEVAATAATAATARVANGEQQHIE
jgi:hypothetical protein